MKDYIKEFKSQKTKKNTLIILSSFAFAFTLNAFLFFTPAWNNLQTSVKNYSTPKTDKEVVSDIYLETWGSWSDIINIKAWSDIKNVSELRFSVVGDPNTLTINDIMTESKSYQVIKSSSVPWVNLVILKWAPSYDVSKWTVLAKILYTKNSSESTSLNLIETQFVSDKEVFELNNSWVEF